MIACPHALGLAIPLVIALSTAVSAKAGILVKDRLALERMRTVDTVLFDKTGTLTKGAHVVTGVAAIAGLSTTTRRCASPPASRPTASTRWPGRSSPPPASEAAPPRPTTSGRSPDAASQATIDGVAYAVGGPALLRERSLDVPADLRDAVDAWQQRGAAVLTSIRGDDVVAGLRPRGRDPARGPPGRRRPARSGCRWR